MALISQAVKSDLPLGEAIRISVTDAGHRNGRRLLRFADLLDEGLEPLEAARQANLPKRLTEQLEAAQAVGDFADYFEELTLSERARSETWRILSQLSLYPLLLAFALFVLAILAMVILPQFEAIFIDFGGTLPAITRVAFRIGHALRHPLIWILAPLVILGLFLIQYRFFPTFWYYFPIAGRLFRALATQKLLGQMILSLRRQRPLGESLEIAARSFGHRAYRRECLQAAALAVTGTTFPALIHRFPLLFPCWLVPFVEAAAGTDVLAAALQRAQKILEEEQSGALLLFSTVFVPFFSLCFLFFTFFLVLALFLPLLKLITCLSA